MLSFPTLMLLMLASLTSSIVSGSRGLQPELQLPPFRSLRSNATDSHHDKRWLVTETGTGNGDVKVWPDKTVRYAFEDLKFFRKILPSLKAALVLWDAAGLSAAEYKWTPISLKDCMKDRTNCLLIKEKARTMQASCGRVPANSKKGVDGPFMNLDSTTNNNRAVELSYAHEIGHVWGLAHEHQNPAFWSYKYVGGYDGTAFSEKNFACEKLADYQEKLALARDTTRPTYVEGQDRRMCYSWLVANVLGFSAVQFLPFDQGGFYSEKGETSQGPDDVDWASIMIYPTNIISTPILTKPDGSEIPFPSRPSAKDVLGIQHLYSGSGRPATVDNSPPLLNLPSNGKQSLFKQLFCGCCSADQDE